ncbi:MAG TPA: ATP-binding protein [Magnetospirillaceae bacterium]|jgi:signal transduction histidine kinase/CheY-like chemotaxis protein
MTGQRAITSILEWFIPASLKEDPDTYRRAQMFVGAHVFGPPLGHLIAIYLYIIDPTPGWHWWCLTLALAAYYFFPFILRATGRFTLLSLLSMQNLAFIVLLTSFYYGGVSSPFLVWVPVVPLLAFYYLGAKPKMRVIVLSVVAVNLAIFYAVHLSGVPFPEHVPLSQLGSMGIFSVCICVVFVSIMSLYYERIAILASEIKGAHVRAEQNRQMAEMANRAKSEFLARISHELRTPLNSVLGFAQLLEMNPKEPLTARQGRQVAQIRRSGTHLLALIDEILDLSKIESGTIRVSIERVPLGLVIDQLRETLQPLADSAGVSLSIDIADDLLTVRADRIRLAQILMNLGTNAIKYNRRGGSIAIEARSDGHAMVSIAVADTGPGIPFDRQGEVFQPFNRLGAENSAVEGTGIGLAISHRLAELMAGALTFISEPDKGSTFTLTLPMAPPADEATIAAEKASSRKTVDFKSADKALTLLYVEDNPPNIALMQELVDTVPNLKLLTAPDGNTGLALAHAHQPDVIVLDINLPGMSGFEVLRRLRHGARTSTIPVLALTAAAQLRDHERGKAAGFRHYLTKPINVQEFLSAIDDVLVKAHDS